MYTRAKATCEIAMVNRNSHVLWETWKPPIVKNWCQRGSGDMLKSATGDYSKWEIN